MTVSNSRCIIETEAQLRELIPWPGKPIKKLAALENQSLNFIAHAPFFVTSVQRPDQLVEIWAYGGRPGFVEVLEDNTFGLPLKSGATAREEFFAGGLFLIPGVNETLRVNGRVKFAGPTTAESGEAAPGFATHEVFMHCAKALIRSKLWKNEDLAGQPHPLGDSSVAHPLTADHLTPVARAFIEKSPFLFLGTSLPDSVADVSPRGDPPGFVKILDDQTLLIPERRGNNLADNLTNILANPWAGLLFLVPGLEAELWVSGEATITTEPDLLERLAEQNKTPLVGIVLKIGALELRPSPALSASSFWRPESKIDRKSFPTLGEIFRDQLSAKVLPKEVTAEAIDKDLAFDSKNHLY